MHVGRRHTTRHDVIPTGFEFTVQHQLAVLLGQLMDFVVLGKPVVGFQTYLLADQFFVTVADDIVPPAIRTLPWLLAVVQSDHFVTVQT